MQLVAVLMISTPTSEDTKTTSLASSPGYEEVGASASLRPGQMVRTREFWILWVTFLLNMQSIGYITSMYKVATILLCNVICMISMHQVYGQTFIQDDHFLAMVGTVAAIFNAGGRVVWGQLCDSFGYKVCMVTVMVLYCTVLHCPVLYQVCMVTVTVLITLLLASLHLTPHLPRPLFAVWVWALYGCICASFILLPTATAQARHNITAIHHNI